MQGFLFHRQRFPVRRLLGVVQNGWTYHKARPMSKITMFSHKKTGSGLVTPSYLQAEDFKWRTAIIDQHGTHTYGDILKRCGSVCRKILDAFNCKGNEDLNGAHVGILCQNDVSYVVAVWATWMAGGVCVPLCKTHPYSELHYYLENSEATAILTTDEFDDVGKTLSSKLNIPDITLDTYDYLSTDGLQQSRKYDHDLTDNEITMMSRRKRRISGTIKNKLQYKLSKNMFRKENAFIVYTSGTTGKPKGVVHTHGSIQASIDNMRTSWDWSKNDIILHTLPLHHVHGVYNALLTPLSCGATCVMLPKFDPAQVWTKLLHSVVPSNPPVRTNVFMAVPTIYAKLIEFYDKHWGRGRRMHWTREYIKSTCQSRIRLMVSGSMALPQPIMERWEAITGHKLLERYGMAECGMALTNPLKGPRIPGTVGKPFPSVEVCITKPNVYSKSGYDVIVEGNSRFSTVTPGMEAEEGELMVKGPSLFKEYYKKPEETKATFTEDGWLKTGDTAVYKDGIYKILGRTSVDIIKSGGYKISALDIERHLLSHPDIKDACVVGLPDITWGQRVAAIIVCADEPIKLPDIKEWAKDKMPPYHIPTILKCVDEIGPRNAMGKINKKDIIKAQFSEYLNPI